MTNQEIVREYPDHKINDLVWIYLARLFFWTTTCIGFVWQFGLPIALYLMTDEPAWFWLYALIACNIINNVIGIFLNEAKIYRINNLEETARLRREYYAREREDLLILDEEYY